MKHAMKLELQGAGDPALKPIGKGKAAQIQFGTVAHIKMTPLRRWLKRAGTDLWDISEILRQRARARRRP
jgi:hypothetical protein